MYGKLTVYCNLIALVCLVEFLIMADATNCFILMVSVIFAIAVFYELKKMDVF